MKSSSRVCVVGAGAVGLSVALYLAEERLRSHPEVTTEIVIFAESFYDKTTSFGSAGYWEPYKIEGTPSDIVNIWGQSTFDFFNTLFKDSDSRVAAGIQLLDSFHLLGKDEELIIPPWKNVVIDFKVLTTQELCNLGSLVPEGTLFPDKKEFHAGFTFKSFTVDQSYYLKYLSDRLTKLGVKIVERKIAKIDDLCQEEFDVVVNCCGLAGSAVSGDSIHCKPIRGQVVRIRAPLLQSIWFYGTSYIIPNIDTVVCGGTAQKDDWNTVVSEEDTVTIMTDIAELIPSLAKAPVVNVWAGLRPSREPLRLDSERRIKSLSQPSDVLVCHCYGHGGSGVTLSWGCAEDLVLNHIMPYLAINRE